MSFLRRRDHKAPGRTWRAIETAPWQVPILAYLLFEGALLVFNTPQVAVEYDLPVWSIYNFAGALTVGSLCGLVGRFRSHIRIETTGMQLILLSLAIAVVLAVMIREYDGLGEIAAYGLAAIFRWIVLSKARKAEKMAAEISGNNHNNEEP